MRNLFFLRNIQYQFKKNPIKKSLLSFLIICPVLLYSQQANFPGTICKDTINDRYLAINSSSTKILQFDKNENLSYLVDNLINPSGMAIAGKIVFIAENKNCIKGFQLKDFSKVFEITLPLSTTLYGLTSDGDSLLFSADTTKNKLIKINFKDSSYKVLTDIAKAQDLEYDKKNNRLLICTSEVPGRVLAYSFDKQYVSTLLTISGLSIIEAIETDSSNNIFLSTYDHIYQCSKKDDYKLHELIQCINTHVYMKVDQSKSKILIANENWTRLIAYDITEFYNKQQIQNQLDLLVQYFNENKMLSIATVYDDDAYILDPGTTFHGKSEIEGYWAPLQNNGESWTLENKIINASIDVLYYQLLYQKMRLKPRGWSDLGLNTSGAYYLLGVSKLKVKGLPVSITDFLLVWRKDNTGKWKILVDSYVAEDLTNGINKLENTSLLSYPNPAPNEINFKFSTKKNELVKLEIFDLNGRLVKSLINKSLTEGEQISKFSVENLNNGIYNCRVTIGIRIESVKFIVSKH